MLYAMDYETLSHNELNDAHTMLNPWRSIWTQPKATIAQLVTTDATHYVIPLAAVGGISGGLNRASIRNFGDTMNTTGIIILVLTLGSLGAILQLYISSALLKWTGSWLNGQASRKEIRTALAWPNALILYNLALWVPEIMLMGREAFMSTTPMFDIAPQWVSIIMLIIISLRMIIAIWSIIVLLKGLAQVQQFSSWTALGNILLSGLVLLVPLGILTLLVVVLK